MAVVTGDSSIMWIMIHRSDTGSFSTPPGDLGRRGRHDGARLVALAQEAIDVRHGGRGFEVVEVGVRVVLERNRRRPGLPAKTCANQCHST